MIIGHLGVALAARSRRKQLPLRYLIAASYAPDLWRLVLAMTGMDWRRNNLYSHGLPWCALLVLGIACAARWQLEDDVAAVVLGGMAASHILLDAISGSKLLWSGGPAGLDLASFQQMELLVEVALIWIGWRLARTDGAGRIARSAAVLALAILIQTGALLVTLGDRPYRIRCLSYPLATCIPDGPLLRRNWNTGLYPQ